jgi:hypothetical protein
MKVGRIYFGSHLTPEQLQERSLERLTRDAVIVKESRPHFCKPPLHFIGTDETSCACGELQRILRPAVPPPPCSEMT